MKYISTFLFLVISNFSWGKALPKSPVDCFYINTACSKVNIVKVDGRKMIKVEVFARINKDLYLDVDTVIGRFVDFVQWPNYVADSENIRFDESQELSIDDRITHSFDYTIKAPWPVRRSRVKGVTHYKEVTSEFAGSLKSYYLDLDKSFSFEGMKTYKGHVHVFNETLKTFEVAFIAIVEPTIKIGLELTKPYIQKPIQEILEGMYK
jgi:hypothetical protein